jgi:leader peptidase (prepilin peptidase)/N-methyltransferase
MTAVGLAVGSFLNVVIHRLPIMMEREWRRDCEALLNTAPNSAREPAINLVGPPSACPHCGHRIRPWENIPLLGYAFLKGRCSSCRIRISIRYPVVELLGGIAGGLAAWHFGLGLAALAAAGLSWALIALSAIDFDHQLLPDAITLPALWAGILLNLDALYVPLEASVVGAAAGYLSLWSVYQVFKLLTGKEGMAAGDFKLLAMLGAWLGWQQLPLIILLSSALGAVVGISLIVFKGHAREKPIPFGPYLAIAGWIALFWGEELARLYLGGAGI